MKKTYRELIEEERNKEANGSDGEEGSDGDVFSSKNFEKAKQKREHRTYWRSILMVILYSARVIHLSSAMMTCCIIILNCLFNNVV